MVTGLSGMNCSSGEDVSKATAKRVVTLVVGRCATRLTAVSTSRASANRFISLLTGGGFRDVYDGMLRGLVAMKLERNVGLPLAAAEHFLIELVLPGSIGAAGSEKLRSLLEGRAGLRFTLVVMFPV